MRRQSTNDEHLFNCISTLIENKSSLPSVIRILDIGCGSGRLVHTIQHCLKLHYPDINFEVYGLDVFDSGFVHNSDSPEGYISDAISDLTKDFPEVDWSERIHLISSEDDWPFPQNHFDFIVSNQVFEHIHNKKSTFERLFKFLKNNGHSIHLAQVKECYWEFHIDKPFAHRFKSYKALYFYLYTLNYLRKLYKRKKIDVKNLSVNEAKFIHEQTSYSSVKEIRELSKSFNLKSDFNLSYFYYSLKLRKLLRSSANLKSQYPSIPNPIASILLSFLKRISSVTLHLQK